MKAWWVWVAMLAAVPMVYGQPATRQRSFDRVKAQAQAAMAAERVPEAIRLYTRATKLKPGWSEGWWHLGTLLFDSARYREARDAFTHFVGVERKQPGPGYAMLGLSEFHLKQYPKSLSALERGQKLGLGTNLTFNRMVLYHDGILLNLAGHSELALVRLNRAANLIAAAHTEGPREAVLADADLLDAMGAAGLRVSRLPADVPPEQRPIVRMAGRIQALTALKDRIAAEAEFKQLLALYPTEPGVHYFYGEFLLKEHPPLALDEFRREIEVSPSHTAARIQLALQFLQAGDYEQGLKYVEEAIALAPANFAAHVVYGRMLLGLNKIDQALNELRTAVKLAPGSPDAHYALSRALARAGRTAEAEREAKEFQRLKALADTADQ